MISKDKRPHPSSIRTRLNLLVIGAVTLSVLPAAALVAGESIQREAQARLTTATGTAALLAGNAVDAAQSHNANTANAIMRAATQIPGVAYARLDLPNGQMLAEAGAGSRLPTDVMLDAGTSHAHITGLAFRNTVRVIASVRQGPNTLGEVTIVQSFGNFVPDLLRALAGILVLGGCALAGSLYLARRMQNAMICPLGELTQSMDEARRYGDLSRRVVTASRDEIGTLADSYNLMLEALGRRDVQPAAAEAEPAPIEVNQVEAAPMEEAPIELAQVEPAVAIEADAPIEAVAPVEPEVATEFAAPVPVVGPATDIDVLDWADGLVVRFADAARAKGLELVTFADPAAPRHAMADAKSLDTVVTALLANALTFTEAGHISLEIAADPKPDFWRLVVNDTGAGIPRSQLKSILKVSETENAATSADAPLRLPVVRQLVEAMGGAMAVTSEAGGSQFHIRLPATSEAPTAAPPRADGCTLVLSLSATAERRALAARFEAAGVSVIDNVHDADLVLTDGSADDLDVPADRLVFLTGPGDDGDAWIAAGRAWAALRRPLRYRDIDALIEILARDADGDKAGDETLDEPAEITAATPVPSTWLPLDADLAAPDEIDEVDFPILVAADAPEPYLQQDTYAKQGPEALAWIVAAFQAGDNEAMADAARRLWTLSAAVGATSVAETAEGIERAIRAEHRAVTIDELARLHARLDRALASLADAETPALPQAMAS